jgi:hypothetical protein
MVDTIYTHKPHLVVLESHSCLSNAWFIGRNVTEKALSHRHAISFVFHPFA